MNVRKSDNSVEEYSVDKISRGICEAYASVGEECPEGLIDSLAKNLYIYENIKTSEIRRQVEECLMSVNKKVAKAYITKFEEIDANGKVLRDKNDFITNYIHASNASTGSKYDPNANVSNKNIATLNAEIPKQGNIQFNRYNTSNKIANLYSKKLAKQYIEDLNSHIIYKNDEASFGINSPYCVAIQSYPFLVDGLKGLGGLSAAPKNLDSFCGMFVNLVFAVSSQFAGACMYKDQNIIVKKDDNIVSIKSKDFVNEFSLDKSYSNYQGDWEYKDISSENYFVYEDGKFVKINKVYRRKYNKNIYHIKSHGHLDCLVSEDHIFKTLYRGREIEVKAKDLNIGETVFVDKDYANIINKNSSDYKDGQFLGLVCGDGNITNDYDFRVTINNNQMFINDFLFDYVKNSYGKEGTFKCDKRQMTYGNFRVSSKDIISDIRNKLVKVEKYDSYNKNIDITNKTLDFQLGFLDGLLTADGSFSLGKGFKLSIANEGLINTVKKILTNLNINKPIISSYKGKYSNKKELFTIHVPLKCIKYFKMCIQKPNTSSKLNVGEDYDLDKMCNEVYWIGKDGKKTSSASKVSSLGNVKDNSVKNLKLDIIESINKFQNDDEYVYEIETESHWYNCGGFITHNCAIAGTFNMFDYYARKEWGDDYYKHDDMPARMKYENGESKPISISKQIEQYFQQIVYSINQPAAARGFQSA